LGLGRSTYYFEAKPEPEFNLQLMEKLDRIFMDFPFLGARRMVQHLRSEGIEANRKRVGRLMAIMGLEPIYPRPRTTRKSEKNKVYPYLLKGLKVTFPDQVWCTDITYVPMPTGHMYLAAIMDWHSRFVIAWNLSNTLDGSFCLEMLDEALAKGKPRIFNTDQGVQFTCAAWTKKLEGNGIRVSMDGRGCFYDNIFIERLWRTVKYEEIYLKGHREVKELQGGLNAYFRYYNEKRYHQALNYKFPSEVYYGKPIKLRGA
jgi:putative transposase